MIVSNVSKNNTNNNNNYKKNRKIKQENGNCLNNRFSTLSLKWIKQTISNIDIYLCICVFDTLNQSEIYISLSSTILTLIQ